MVPSSAKKLVKRFEHTVLCRKSVGGGSAPGSPAFEAAYIEIHLHFSERYFLQSMIKGGFIITKITF